jgi:ABC-2 type transport system ATP-binding protein
MITSQINNIYKSFGKISVLENISFETLEQCKCLAILGRNGAGKTTFMRILTGLLKPTAGSITIQSELVKNAPFFSPQMATYVPETNLAIEIITAKCYFETYQALNTIAGVSTDVSLRKDLIKRLDFEEYENRIIQRLSKGNKRKVEIIAALSANTEMTLLDEPCDGLDIPSRLKLSDIINELKAKNKTVWISSHDLDFVASVCDSVVIIDNKTIVANIERSNINETELKKIIAESYRL